MNDSNSGVPLTGSPFHDKSSKQSPLSSPHPAGSSLNPRSCVTCRKRKVKCDKRHPCSNCTKAHIDCIFPAPGRAPRRPRKPPDSELLARLRRLEGVVQSLGVTVDDDQPSSDVASDHAQAVDYISHRSVHDAAQRVRHDHHPQTHHRSSLDSRFGRLVVEEGKSRYVNNNFWASLNNEVEDLKGILYDSSEEEDTPSPGSAPQSIPSHQAFIFNCSSLAVDLHSMHPPPELIPVYWQIYEEYCDPLIKMIHAPTMREQIFVIAGQVGRPTKGMEAMLFAIYFAAVTSLTPEECETQLGDTRPALVSRYRFCLEQALARANFLVTEELIVLQSFIIYLLSLRRHEEARTIWSLCGLVIRTAVRLGLHRDGTDFDLPPFEAEIRRRTWWQICMLDIRTSDDHGCDPTVTEHISDTKPPLNINDDDLSPLMSEPPRERVDITDMTFSCIRHDITTVYRKLIAPVQMDGTDQDRTLEDRELIVAETHRRLEEKYLRHCDMNIPMQWVMCMVARLIMSKMWLIVYHPFQRMGGNGLPQDTKDRLFVTSLESIEYALLLEREAKAVKWGWFFKTYHQWHALAFLLTELCSRTKGDVVSRAWRAVDATVAGWGGSKTDHKKNNMWKPLRRLITTARAARDRQLASERKATGSDMSAEPLAWSEIRNATMLQGLGASALPSGTNAMKVESSMTVSGEEDLGAQQQQRTTGGVGLQLPYGTGEDTMPLTAASGFQTDSMIFPNAFISDSLPFTEPNELTGLLPPQSNSDWAMHGGYDGVETATFAQESGMGSSDAMLDGGEDPSLLQWAYFDDMVREFEQDNGGVGGGNGGLNASGVGNQWQPRSPLMGDTWL